MRTRIAVILTLSAILCGIISGVSRAHSAQIHWYRIYCGTSAGSHMSGQIAFTASTKSGEIVSFEMASEKCRIEPDSK